MNVLALVMLAGCPAGGDDVSPDAGGSATHLSVTWSSTPAVPGPSASGVSVRELHIAYSSVQLIGDAAPGDSRTSRGSTELEWEVGAAPPPLDFATAPPGLYARLELGAGGGPEAFKIEGELTRDDGLVEFEIEDEASNPVSLPIAVDLRPGTTTTVPLVIDLAAVLSAVRFDDLPVVLGRMTLDRDDPQMAAVRAAMARAVTVAGVAARQSP